MIRIGIVGCGRILAAHLRGYRLLREAGYDEFRITALCARQLDDAHSYAKRGHGPPQRPAVSTIPGDPLAVCDEYVSDMQDDVDVQVYDDYREMIAAGPIDAVNDYTLHTLHAEIAELCARHGRHLLTQKPIAVTMAEANRMCELFEDSNLTLGVFENFRFRPDTIRLLRLLEQGTIGKPQMAIMGAIAAWWAPDRIVAETPWRHVRGQAGGITLDMGVHQFDFIRAVGGEIDTIDGRVMTVEPRRFTRSADGSVSDEIDCDADDTYFATSESIDGVLGHVHASWAGHGGGTITGAGGLVYTTKGRVNGSSFFDDAGQEHSLDQVYTDNISTEQQRSDFPFGIDDGFALTQLDWLEAIRQKREPVISGREGLLDLACAHAVLESSLAGRRVHLDEIISGDLCEYSKLITQSQES